jgi:RNA polymerase sigma-70 factor (ECF subfamily)
MPLLNKEITECPYETDDDSLVASVLAGNLVDFEKIMRRYNQRNFRLARGYLKEDAEAMDVVQEAYISAYNHLDQYQGPAKLSAWLGTIVRNEALMRLRKKQNVHYMNHEELTEVSSVPPNHGTLSPTERSVGSRQLGQLIETCINQLPEDFRVVFMMRGVEQLSIQETSVLTGVQPETVKTRYHRARKIMQALINKQIESEEIRAFEFAGSRCDQIVLKVMLRIR